MRVDWGALGEVFVAALGTGVGVVVLFTIGLRGLSQRARAGASGGRTSGTATAVLSFAACAGVVLWGLYVIVAR